MRPIGVVGLGTVGRTVARAFSEAGVPVRGYDPYIGLIRADDLGSCRVVLVCVPTPTAENGSYDLDAVWSALAAIEPHLETGAIVAVKSTVPPGTSDRLAREYPRLEFASVPEFLVADRPMETFTHPDRIVIGCSSAEAGSELADVMRMVIPAAPILFVQPTEAELVKLCSNAMLASKVALANELSEVAARFGVAWPRTQQGIGLDPRIGPSHLTVTQERGFGGHCLPKDLDGLISATQTVGYRPALLEEVAEFNRRIRAGKSGDEPNTRSVPKKPARRAGLVLSRNGGAPPPDRAEAEAKRRALRRGTASEVFPASTRVSDEGRRFLFYSHDGVGLGHTRRNLAIARALSRLSPGSPVLLATSADEVERLGVPANVDLLRLPAVRKIENGRYESRRLTLPWEEIRAVRSRLLAAAVESFRPAVLLADKHPLGAGGELEEALEVARTSGSRAVLGLRDILDDPAAVRAEWATSAISARIPDYYDRVLVYGQPGVGIPVREYGLPDEIQRMTFFCGYVFGPSEESSCTEASGYVSSAGRPGPLVLATAGGGEDGFQLLESFIQAAASARWRAIVVAGPQCGEDDRRLLSTLAADAGVAFRTFVPGLAALFSKVDALVCMGGYNTLVEAAAAGTPTVCVPRVRPRREQLLRGQAFARLGLVQVLDQDPVEPTVLREEVESMLGVSRATLRKRAHAALFLDGAPRAARHLLEVAGHGSRRGRAVARAFTA